MNFYLLYIRTYICKCILFIDTCIHTFIIITIIRVNTTLDVCCRRPHQPTASVHASFFQAWTHLAISAFVFQFFSFVVWFMPKKTLFRVTRVHSYNTSSSCRPYHRYFFELRSCPTIKCKVIFSKKTFNVGYIYYEFLYSHSLSNYFMSYSVYSSSAAALLLVRLHFFLHLFIAAFEYSLNKVGVIF